MSVQDDKAPGQGDDQQTTDTAEDRPLTEKPEPNEEQKGKAAEMMTAYEDRPTVVLPGSGAMVTGTAVNDWLDDEGNPTSETPEGSDSKAADAEADSDRDENAYKEQVEKDKALNDQLREAAAADNKGEKD